MDTQRSRRIGQRGRAPLLDQQKQLLDDIEFPWIANRQEAKWNAHCEELVRFQKDHGDCKPSSSTHGKLYGLISNRQIELLDKIEFPWKGAGLKSRKMFHEQNTYYYEDGHLSITREDKSKAV